VRTPVVSLTCAKEMPHTEWTIPPGITPFFKITYPHRPALFKTWYSPLPGGSDSYLTLHLSLLISLHLSAELQFNFPRHGFPYDLVLTQPEFAVLTSHEEMPQKTRLTWLTVELINRQGYTELPLFPCHHRLSVSSNVCYPALTSSTE